MYETLAGAKVIILVCEKFDFYKEDIFEIINVLEEEKFIEIR